MEETRRPPERLLYICGGGHSGSTLLDMLLGGHPAVTSVGEVSTLNHYIEREQRGYVCSCGQPAEDCPFWQAVMARLAAATPTLADTELAREPDPSEERENGNGSTQRAQRTIALSRALPLDMRRRHARTPSLRRQYFLSALYCTLGGNDVHDQRWLRRLAPDIMNRMDDVHRLFDAIRHVRSTPVVLDSSKHAYRLRLLHALRPDAVRCIFLVRDGRARTYSHMRREGVSAETAAKLWVEVNRKTRRLITPIPPTHRTAVTYEELCRAPEETLARLCNFAGLDPVDSLLDMHFGDAHNIGGNRARFGQLNEIREDTRWREEMTAEALAVFESIGGPLNRELLGEHYRD